MDSLCKEGGLLGVARFWGRSSARRLALRWAETQDEAGDWRSGLAQGVPACGDRIGGAKGAE
jgi:hypothetical protein